MAATVTDTQGIIAIAAGAVAVVALIGCALLAVSVRRLRRAQRLVLGEQGEHDLVAHAAGMQGAFEALSAYVDDVAARLDGRLAATEAALQGAIAHHALVRYDAYNELSGHQSVSIALLDEHQSGIVLSCIHHRDHAIEPVLRAEQAVALEGMQHRYRVGEAGGFDEHAVEVDHFAGAPLDEQFAQGFLQVGAHGAAQAAVAEQCHLL